MSKSNALENQLLEHILNNAAIALVGDATGLRGSSSAGSLYVSLHTADPGEAGDQTTNEAGYTSYARVAVSRAGAGWTVTNDTGVNAAAVTWPACTGSTSTATHFGVGTDSSGAGKLLYSGALTAQLIINPGVTPESAAGDLSISES